MIAARGAAILASAAASQHFWNADDQYLEEARLGPPHLAIPECPENDALGMAGVRDWRERLVRGEPRDRYAFHRTSKDKQGHDVDEIVFECDDFRHGGDEVHLHFAVFAGGVSSTGRVRATVTAANAGEPVEAVCEFECSEVKGDIDELAQAMARLRVSGVALNRAAD